MRKLVQLFNAIVGSIVLEDFGKYEFDEIFDVQAIFDYFEQREDEWINRFRVEYKKSLVGLLDDWKKSC